MKNNKFSSYAFWVAVTGAVVIFLQNFAKAIGIDFNSTAFESVVLSFCGILVVLGVINKDDKKNVDDTSMQDEKDTNQNETDNDNNED